MQDACCPPASRAQPGWRTSIEVVRRAVKERDFFLSVATLEGRLDADEAGRQRTALAEATLVGSGASRAERILQPVSGGCSGGALVVVAMGKAGGREMMAGSDLDLMFIYDHPPEVTESRGAAQPAHQPVVRPGGTGVRCRADGARPGRPDVCTRYAAAAVGQQRTARCLAGEVQALPRNGLPGPGSAWR